MTNNLTSKNPSSQRFNPTHSDPGCSSLFDAQFRCDCVEPASPPFVNSLTQKNPNSQRYVQQPEPAARRIDLRVSNFGSITLLKPLTPAANEWIDEHVDHDPDQRWFGGALVVEPRYLRDLVAGALRDGLGVI